MPNLNQQTETMPIQQQEEENEADALSLCDFPLNRDEPERNPNPHHHRRSSSQPPEYAFEFSNDPNSDYMSHAEDIIHCGQLMPFRHHQQQKQRQQPRFDESENFSLSEDYESDNFSRRHCDSLPNRSNRRLTRSSRSLDRKQLRRNSSLVMKSEASDIRRSMSKGLAKSEAVSKPRWYDLMFGIVKVIPPEMDLRDMKNRQIRRSPGSMFAAVDAGGGSPAAAMRRSSWGNDWLKVLSCRDYSSSVDVSVTTSCRRFESRDSHVRQLRYSS